MDIWKHKALVHGVAYNEEILLYALTEQNYDLGSKVSSLELATRENTVEVKKLDGVGPVDNRPSTDKLHHVFQKKRKKEEKNYM